MIPIKEFTTAVREAEADAPGLMTFTIDGRELTCYHPGDGQIAVLMASVGRHASFHQQVAGIINFFVEVMDEDSHAYVVGRLLDREDQFGLTEVTSVMEWMIEEWTGNPTQKPSVSTASPSTTGPNSTPVIPAST